MIYDLPTTVEIQGREYEVRSDYRAVLDICIALSDPEFTDQEKALITLITFYPQIEEIPQESYQEALDKCMDFINCGEGEPAAGPKLVDWEQDFKYIVAPINRVCGKEIRSIEYMHWWTFISNYYEIGGDCLFAQIVRIRDKQAKGKKLNKEEREWMRKNGHLVRFKTKHTSAEQEILKMWT